MAHAWHLPIREDWLAQVREPALEPELPIVDSHHHLWDLPGRRYRASDLADEIAASGHRVVATVFMDSSSGYLDRGPEPLRSAGETSWVRSQARGLPQASPRIGLGIVSRTDLRLGERVADVLEAHLAAGDGHFRGIRQLAIWDDDASLTDPLVIEHQGCAPGLLADASFRAGFRWLAKFELSFDTWLYSPQIAELSELADAFPEAVLVLNHCGTPLAQGVYAARRQQTRADWARALAELGRRPNVFCKLGGIAKWLTGSLLHEQAQPPTSKQLAAEWGPDFEVCLEAFGPDRCMFESNFPQEKSSCSYGVFWNACKRISSPLSTDERQALFYGTARRAYRLDLPESPGGPEGEPA